MSKYRVNIVDPDKNLSSEDKQVKEYRLDSNLILLYSDYETISDLENDYTNFLNMDDALRHVSDDESIRIFGKDNRERYDEILHKLYSKPDPIYNTVIQSYIPPDPKVIIDPLDNLFIAREMAKDPDYIKNISRNYFLTNIQENNSIFDINMDREEISNIIESELQSENIWDDSRVVFPALEYNFIKEHLDDNINDLETKKWRNAYFNLMVGSNEEYVKLTEFWKNTIIDLYEKLQQAISLEDKPHIKIFTNNLIAFGWNPAIRPSDSNIDKASELTREQIKTVLKKYEFYDLTKLDPVNTDSVPDNADTKIVPFLYIMAIKKNNNYVKFLFSKDKDFSNFIEISILDGHEYPIISHIKSSLEVYIDESIDVFVIPGCWDNDNEYNSDSNIMNRFENMANSDNLPNIGSNYKLNVDNKGGFKLFLHTIFNYCVMWPYLKSSINYIYKIYDGNVKSYINNPEDREQNLKVLYLLKIKCNNAVTGLSESTTNEFPVEFDKDGNLLINKGKNLDFEGEYSRTHLALKLYETNINIVGMKYCLCKLWYLNIVLEDKIHDSKTDKSKVKEYYKSRAKIMNDIKKYTPIILKKDPNFDILKTYQNSPFNNERITIKSSTMFYLYETIKKLLTFKDLKNIFK
jgi:hypothetical protein